MITLSRNTSLLHLALRFWDCDSARLRRQRGTASGCDVPGVSYGFRFCEQLLDATAPSAGSIWIQCAVGLGLLVQSLSHVRLFATPWTAAGQASLSFTISQSLLKFMIIESLMPSKHLILFLSFFSCLQSFQHQGLFQLSRLVTSGGWSFGSSVSVPVLAMNIQGWFPLGLTGLISLQFKETVPLSPERDFTKLSGQKVLGMKPEYHSHESYMLIVVCNT